MDLHSALTIMTQQKMKEIYPAKIPYISGNETFLPQKNLIKLFKNVWLPKTLHKTPLGETKCLTIHYSLLFAQVSSFLIHFL